MDSLFSTLKTYGSTYPVEFRDTVYQELLFPIVAVLKLSVAVDWIFQFCLRKYRNVCVSVDVMDANESPYVSERAVRLRDVEARIVVSLMICNYYVPVAETLQL